jgi:hypothetical protein
VSPAEVIAVAAARGVRVGVRDGRLTIRSAAPAPDDVKALVRAHRPALLAYLAAEPWDLAAALHLMDQADAAVEQSGVSGTHPEVRAAAAAVCAASAAKDLAVVRAACAAMTTAVRRLAGA